jgi:hypothetical protein
MHLPGFIDIPLRLVVLLVGFVLPGSLFLRALRLPWSLAAAFVSSSVALYVIVLVLTCAHLTISLATLSLALGMISGVCFAVPIRSRPKPGPSSFSCFSGMGRWLPLYLIFWAVVGWRLSTQPLSGPDVYFRWSYLAEQMLQVGSLDFYPPRTGADFLHYFWTESIPPGVASLYAWAYGCGGNLNPLWTSPVVALQLYSLHEIIWRLANRWGGEIVARRAVLLAAACPLLTWSVLIGQETGLTALTVTGLIWCLPQFRQEDGRRWAALAGVFAIGVASTREYGPVFAVAALAAAPLLRAPRRSVEVYALVALPLALAWPLRVWFLTGNPFYSLDLGGLAPTNSVFVSWSEAFHAPHQNTLHTVASWLALVRYWLLWALPAAAGLLLLPFLWLERWREAVAMTLFVVLTLVLWWISLGHTAGGLFYSLRVLSPAFALLVIAASDAFGLLLQRSFAIKLSAVLISLALIEALPKTLVLPENPYRLSPANWPTAGRQFTDSVRAAEAEIQKLVGALPGKGRLLTDNAGLPRLLAPIGVQVIPLWSPDVAWLFQDGDTPEEVARKWKAEGFQYIAIGKAGPSADYIRNHVRWRAPYFTLKTAVETDTWLILEASAVPSALAR